MAIPDFISTLRTVDHSIEELLEGALDEELLAGWLEVAKGDRIQAERAMNHRHMLDVLGEQYPPSQDGYDCDDLLYFSQFYASTLKRRLIEKYPGQMFTIEIIGKELVKSDPLELTVTFFRKILK